MDALAGEIAKTMILDVVMCEGTAEEAATPTVESGRVSPDVTNRRTARTILGLPLRGSAFSSCKFIGKIVFAYFSLVY